MNKDNVQASQSYADGLAQGFYAAMNGVDRNEYLRGFSDGWSEAKGEIREGERHARREKMTEAPKEDL